MDCHVKGVRHDEADFSASEGGDASLSFPPRKLEGVDGGGDDSLRKLAPRLVCRRVAGCLSVGYLRQRSVHPHSLRATHLRGLGCSSEVGCEAREEVSLMRRKGKRERPQVLVLAAFTFFTFPYAFSTRSE